MRCRDTRNVTETIQGPVAVEKDGMDLGCFWMFWVVWNWTSKTWKTIENQLRKKHLEISPGTIVVFSHISSLLDGTGCGRIYLKMFWPSKLIKDEGPWCKKANTQICRPILGRHIYVDVNCEVFKVALCHTGLVSAIGVWVGPVMRPFHSGSGLNLSLEGWWWCVGYSLGLS